MKSLRSSAFTLIELLVVISIIGILAALALPALAGALVRGQMTQTLSNMKQLHLASQQVALDGVTTGDTNLVWPGDQTTPSWGAWATNLVPAYLGTNDFNKLMSAPGVIRPSTQDPSTKAPNALNVYAIQESSSGNTVFLSTANWSNSSALTTAGKPYADKGFVIFHKAGDGAILLKNQATNTTLTGISSNTVL
jgi:prepilin-type N-terminal cleavage/methylation domain-containing protein